jgi:hypothetical protein
VRRSALALGGGIAALLVTARASAQASPGHDEPLPAGTQLEIAPQPLEGKTSQEAGGTGTGATNGADTSEGANGEAPPARPRHKGLVLESTLGVLGFAGKFRHVAPPGYWLHTQLGYEVLPWLMLFGEGEISFTDTSESQGESNTLAFPIWGFGGGARATVHASDRVAVFGQGDLGALTADVPHDALTAFGFRSAESIGAAFGLRVGVEWYQIDRHMALCTQAGARYAQGFGKLTASDTPLLWDWGIGIRYTF